MLAPNTKIEWFGRVQKRGLEICMAAPANTEPDAVYSPRRIHVEASRGDPQQKGSRSVDRKQTYDGGGCASIF